MHSSIFVSIVLVITTASLSFAWQLDTADKQRDDQSLQLKLENPIAAFEDWTIEFNRTYVKGSPEWRRRFEIWVTNLYHAVEYNKKQSSHWLTMTALADMERVEVKQHLLGFMKPVGSRTATPLTNNATVDDLADVPRRIDWRERSAVTSVKDQRRCGACWAFSAVGSIEGLKAILDGKLVELSEQQLIDCDSYDGGCSGGHMTSAFQWITENGGITTAKKYSYEASSGHCKHRKTRQGSYSISGFQKVETSESSLIRALSKQPVSVAIHADLLEVMLYGGGIFDAACGSKIDHAALAVGYDLDEGYIIVKNSWSEYWGEEGYIRLALNKNNGTGQCGVATMASFPTADTPIPSPAPNPPIKCTFSAYCEANETCCCNYYVWNICIEWGCCPRANPCCANSNFCCPNQQPGCDVSEEQCRKARPLKLKSHATDSVAVSSYKAPNSRKISFPIS